MGIPAVPLSDFMARQRNTFEARGGKVHMRAAVDSFQTDGDGVRLCVGGEDVRADYAVLATPFHGVEKLLPDTPEMEALRRDARSLQSSPITGIHLWFDREITALEHAVLLERTIQWMFHKSKILATREEFSRAGKLCRVGGELVEDAGGQVAAEIIELAVRELAGVFSRLCAKPS